VDIDLKSFRFTTVLNHDSIHSIQLSSLVENLSRIRPIQHLFKYLFRAIKFQMVDLFRL